MKLPLHTPVFTLGTTRQQVRGILSGIIEKYMSDDYVVRIDGRDISDVRSRFQLFLSKNEAEAELERENEVIDLRMAHSAKSIGRWTRTEKKPEEPVPVIEFDTLPDPAKFQSYMERFGGDGLDFTNGLETGRAL